MCLCVCIFRSPHPGLISYTSTMHIAHPCTALTGPTTHSLTRAHTRGTYFNFFLITMLLHMFCSCKTLFGYLSEHIVYRRFVFTPYAKSTLSVVKTCAVFHTSRRSTNTSFHTTLTRSCQTKYFLLLKRPLENGGHFVSLKEMLS